MCRYHHHRHHYQVLPSFLFRGLLASSLLSSLALAAGYQFPDNPSNNKMKAWHCHGRSQRELVERLRQANIVKSTAVKQVMEQVDRKYYIGDNYGGEDFSTVAYQDTPLGIDKQQTISAPHMHALVLEELWPAMQRANKSHKGAVKVLDVGCGSGYLTACLGRFMQPVECDDGDNNDNDNNNLTTTTPLVPLGRVFGMDIHPELVQFSRDNINKNDGDLLESGVITLKYGNGWLGWPEEAPFDAIHVGAAAATFPTELALQLALHGVLIVPVGPMGGAQTLVKVERVSLNHNNAVDNNNIHPFVWDDFKVTQLLGVRYVPLVQRPN